MSVAKRVIESKLCVTYFLFLILQMNSSSDMKCLIEEDREDSPDPGPSTSAPPLQSPHPQQFAAPARPDTVLAQQTMAIREYNKHSLHAQYQCGSGITILGGDKVSMLIHTYAHKSMRLWSSATAIIRQTTHFRRNLLSDLVICKHRKERSYITLNCPTETMSFNNPAKLGNHINK